MLRGEKRQKVTSMRRGYGTARLFPGGGHGMGLPVLWPDDAQQTV